VRIKTSFVFMLVLAILVLPVTAYCQWVWTSQRVHEALKEKCFRRVASILLTKRPSCRIALSEKCSSDPHVRSVILNFFIEQFIIWKKEKRSLIDFKCIVIIEIHDIGFIG